MRHKHLFLGDDCLASDIGEGPVASLSFAFFCPGCGRVWARLEGTGRPLWACVRHHCGVCPASADALIAFPGDRIRGLSPDLSIPGSVIACRPSFFPPETIPGLFLTSPQLANREVMLWGKWMT